MVSAKIAFVCLCVVSEVLEEILRIAIYFQISDIITKPERYGIFHCELGTISVSCAHGNETSGFTRRGELFE
jgi:hypothetical protein